MTGDKHFPLGLIVVAVVISQQKSKKTNKKTANLWYWRDSPAGTAWFGQSLSARTVPELAASPPPPGGRGRLI